MQSTLKKLSGISGTTVTMLVAGSEVRVGDVLDGGRGEVTRVDYFGPQIAVVDCVSVVDPTDRMVAVANGHGRMGVKESTELAGRMMNETYLEGYTEIIVVELGHRGNQFTFGPDDLFTVVRPTLLGQQVLLAS